MIERLACLWAWPMVNVYKRLLAYEKLPEPGLEVGVLPVAPSNHLCMLHDYIEPSERAVTCPKPPSAWWPGGESPPGFQSEVRPRSPID
jgi:hypothetical protein